MVRLAIIQEQKSLKQRLDFPVEENIKSMDSMAIIQEQKIVETTVRFSISKKRSKLWID